MNRAVIGRLLVVFWLALCPASTAPLGAATEVVVDLAEVGTGTLLDLRHRGIGEGPAWDEAIGGYFAAWLQALAALGVLVESGVDARPAEALLAVR